MKRRVKYHERFQELRAELEGAKRKITQAELGKLIGLSASAISDLERGKREPTVTELKAYHNCFNVPLEYLLGLSNSRDYQNTSLGRELGLSDNTINLLMRSRQMDIGIVELINNLCDSEDGFKFMLALFQFIQREPFLFIDPSSSKTEEKYLNQIEIRNNDNSIDILDAGVLEELRLMNLCTLIKYLKDNPIKINWAKPERSNVWLMYKREKMLEE